MRQDFSLNSMYVYVMFMVSPFSRKYGSPRMVGNPDRGQLNMENYFVVEARLFN